MKYLFQISTLLFAAALFQNQKAYAQGSCASPDGSFFPYDGSNPDYATANANGWCYNNLNAGQTYCWTYFYPTTGSFKLRLIKNQSCGGCDGTLTLNMPTVCSGGCSSVGTIGCGGTQYNSSCAVQEINNIEHGGSGACTPAQTCGTIFTICITVPAGCSTMDVCPMVYCPSGPSNCLGTLPVEMLNINASCKKIKNGSAAEINWSTASELNNDFFTLERSIDGIKYETITTIKGNGTTSSTMHYSFIDYPEYIFSENMTLYYRLSQTDFDGTSTIYTPVSVQMECAEDIIITPTLSDGEVFIISPDISAPTEITVHDMTGRRVFSKTIYEEWTKTQLDLSQLVKGIYTISITHTETIKMKKLILK